MFTLRVKYSIQLAFKETTIKVYLPESALVIIYDNVASLYMLVSLVA